MNKIINSRWYINYMIGEGSFGSVYNVTDLTNGVEYAAKIENSQSKHSQLRYEYSVYNKMAVFNSPWLPKIYWFGYFGKNLCMVMDLLGISLDTLLAEGKLTLTDVINFAPKMIQRLELIHTVIIHRDIKPSNFVFGLGNKSETIYLIDFGLSKAYKNKGEHIPFAKNKPFIGTARFASLRTHKGYEQSRRDDLESLAYLLIYLALGQLPWQGFKNKAKKLNQDIYELKRSISPKNLCKNLPKPFYLLLKYARSLEFDEEPDYTLCRELFLIKE